MSHSPSFLDSQRKTLLPFLLPNRTTWPTQTPLGLRQWAAILPYGRALASSYGDSEDMSRNLWITLGKGEPSGGTQPTAGFAQAGSELLSIKPWGLGRFLSLHACPPGLPNRLGGGWLGSSKASAATLVCKITYSSPSHFFTPTMYPWIKLSLHSRPSNLYLPSARITEEAITSGHFFVLPWGKWEGILQWRKA